MNRLALWPRLVVVSFLLATATQIRADEPVSIIREVLSLFEHMVDQRTEASAAGIEQALIQSEQASCTAEDAEHRRNCRITLSNQREILIQIDVAAANSPRSFLSATVYVASEKLNIKEVAELFSDRWKDFAPGRCTRCSLVLSEKAKRHVLAKIVLGSLDSLVHSVTFTYLEGIAPSYPKY
ncbi:hypothetical protein [Roseateles sp. BYS87W]|uniref:Uncharacterized protein n=1 Tax=Pelomonas baiyunensis TaxID=3299026 RepID=A0ABW7GZC3_9BURK